MIYVFKIDKGYIKIKDKPVKKGDSISKNISFTKDLNKATNWPYKSVIKTWENLIRGKYPEAEIRQAELKLL